MLITLVVFFFGCNQNQENKSVSICDSTGDPRMEELFKCGNYQYADFTIQNFYSRQQNEKIPDSQAGFCIITLEKNNMLYGAVIQTVVDVTFSSLTEKSRIIVTEKNKDVVHSASKGSVAFFRKEINDTEISSNCINSGIVKLHHNFDAETAGYLSTCELDIKICVNERQYRILHDSHPYNFK